MNRRSFFQSVLAGIGALVGHKYIPEAEEKPEDFDREFSYIHYVFTTTTSVNGNYKIQAYQCYHVDCVDCC